MGATLQSLLVSFLTLLQLCFGILRWQTPAPVCYEITNGQRFLHPSNAVDPNIHHLQFAVVSPNRTAFASWKLIPTYPSCFRLCNVRTGLYLMVAENDRVYSVHPNLLNSFPQSGLIFGPSYPNWPTSHDARITNTLKMYQLCASVNLEPSGLEQMIVTLPTQGTMSPNPGDCSWQLHQQTVCPNDDLC
uniref:Uncharacterized protein n=1 Tax=Anopheles farauti TaxID=69004 RepID=A0A182QPB1_9DIPT